VAGKATIPEARLRYRRTYPGPYRFDKCPTNSSLRCGICAPSENRS
jgi:hypothetical protein